MREVKGKEGLKTQFSPSRQVCFREIDVPHNQGPTSPKLIEREYKEMGGGCNQSRINLQDGVPSGHARHQRHRELPRRKGTRGDEGAGDILGGSNFVNLSPIFILTLVFSMYYQH